ncbi:MAG: 1-acyl-sn-glycerol-3-phosphate acyltransferase [Planctomycetota bacterium]
MTIASAGVTVACLVGARTELDIGEWTLLGLGSAILWIAYLPLEFVLVSATCGVIGTFWAAGWAKWLPGQVEALDGIGLIGALAACSILLARLFAFRSGRVSVAGKLTALWGLAAILVLLLPPSAQPIAVSLQLAAAAIFAPLGADILLFKGNRRSLPNLKYLLGGLWIFIYITGAQTALFGLVAPIALFFSRDRGGLIRRQCSNGMRFMFSSFPYGRIDRIYLEALTFAKPAVIVSNHQSSVDILLVLSLESDIRMLVGRRVWRTPVLGIGARFLAHVPVEPDDTATTIERSQEKLSLGASLHGFPEGTRSQGSFPRRFRRGAFEIAHELRADVLPLVLCNTRSCVPRDAFWVGDFWMSVKALPRVTPENFDYELGSNALMKHVQGIVRDEVVNENRRIYSNWEYLRKQLDGLYRFQNPGLKRLVRKHLESIGDPSCWNMELHSCEQLLVVDHSSGVLSHLLSLPNLRATCVGWLPGTGHLANIERSAAGNEQLRFVTERPALLGFDVVMVGRGTSVDMLQELLAELAPTALILLEEESEGLLALLAGR